MEKNREAGANPALPRNCKRGHRLGPLEFFREGRGRLWMICRTRARRPRHTNHILTREPGDRRELTTTQPLSRVKEECMRSHFWFVVFLSVVLSASPLCVLSSPSKLLTRLRRRFLERRLKSLRKTQHAQLQLKLLRRKASRISVVFPMGLCESTCWRRDLQKNGNRCPRLIATIQTSRSH